MVDNNNMIEIKKLNKEINKLDKYPCNAKDKLKFEKISKSLSDLLPCVSDSTVFEIDDILYQDRCHSTTNSFDTITKVLMPSNFFSNYIRLCHYMNMNFKRPISLRLLLQLIEHSEESMDERSNLQIIGLFVNRLLLERKEIYICQAIQILKILMLGGEDQIFRALLSIEAQLKVFWLLSLKNIPQSDDPKNKRILSWISEQLTVMIPIYLDVEYSFFQFKDIIMMPHDLLERERREEFMEMFTSQNNGVHHGQYYEFFQNDNLFNYFMSAKNDSEKRERIECFLEGLFKATKKWSKKHHRECYTMFSIYDLNPYRLRFSTCISNLVCGLHELAEKLKRLKVDDELRELEKLYPFKWAPYLPSNIDNSSEKSDCSNLKESINSQNEEAPVNRHDLTFKKLFIYDDFIKRIHVMNILITIFREYSDFLESNGVSQNDEGVIFRKKHTGFIDKLYSSLCSKRYKSNWPRDMLIKNCPFLFLPKHHEHLVEDMLKRLNGEKIKKEMREEIYFSVGSNALTFE